MATVLPVDATDAATKIRDALRGWASSTHYGLRIGVPSWDVAERWGDYHFARALQRSLERDGHPTRVHLLPDWAAPVAARDDVALHIFGLREAPDAAGPGQLLWQISHPDRPPRSYTTATTMSSSPRMSSPRGWHRAPCRVTPLHQATDPERFDPDPTGPPHELLFVANYPARPPPHRGRPRRHGPRPRGLWPGVATGAHRPALRQGRGHPERRVWPVLQLRRRSCSTTTGTTCATRASSRTASTTRWHAERSSSRTTSGHRRRVRRMRVVTYRVADDLARARSIAIWPTRTSAAGSASAAERPSSRAIPSMRAPRDPGRVADAFDAGRPGQRGSSTPTPQELAEPDATSAANGNCGARSR